MIERSVTFCLIWRLVFNTSWFRSLPVSTDDEKSDLNDWGSDFEEASTPPSSRNPANKKISSNHSSIISNSAVSRTPSPNYTNISPKFVQDTTISIPTTKDKAFITNTNKKGLSTFKPIASNPLVKRYETENSTEYTKILNKQKVMSPEITRPKPNISKVRSNANNNDCSSVQIKEEKNASIKLEVCNNYILCCLDYFVLFALHIFSLSCPL